MSDSTTWAAAREGYERGEGIRAIARRLSLLPGTVSKRAVREGWARLSASETASEAETPPVAETAGDDMAPIPTPASAGKRHGSRWQRGRSGNPMGRKPGTRNRATMAAEALLDGEAEALTRKAVELALQGDTVALRLCLERLVPPRRERAVPFAMPALETATDAPRVIAAIVQAVACGELTAGEAAALSALVERFVKTIEVADIEARLTALEERNIKL